MSLPRQDEGAVLLMTLLVMGVMAALAVAIIDEVRFAVKRAGNVQAYAQADWYVQGAEDYAYAYLAVQVSRVDKTQLNAAALNQDPIIFPYEGGAMALYVRDGSRCFSLSALSGEPGRRVFNSLLALLGWDQTSAARLTSIAVDWQDADDQVQPGGAEDYTYLGRVPAYRTAGRSFASVTELRALETMTEEQYQTLLPFICAHMRDEEGDTPRINVNTLTLPYMPLLAAALGDSPMTVNTASRLISERPVGGYTDESQFLASPALADFPLKEAQLELLTYAPETIEVAADVTYLQAHRKAAFGFAIAEGNVKRLYRRFGEVALRPELEDRPDE